MWGRGGRFGWVETSRKGSAAEASAIGIVVLFAWIGSDEEQLKPFFDLYDSLGWRCLVCYPDILSLYFPDKAASLACNIISKLAKELKVMPLPVVFATFSGGSRSCLYKVIQLLDGKLDDSNLVEYQVVRDSVTGLIFDSSPIEFINGEVLPPAPKTSKTPAFVPWMAKILASGLDTIFPSRIETELAEYWRTLYSSVGFGPSLILCSDDDEVVPYHVVCAFAQHLRELGGCVKLIRWSSSPHVGHYKFHPADYKVAITELFDRAVMLFSQRRQWNLQNISADDNVYKIAESVCSLHQAAASSNASLRGVDNDLYSSILENSQESREATALDKPRKELFNLPSVEPQGVLGKILFDVCVPKNVEGWDFRPGMPAKAAYAFGRRHGTLNPMKYLRSRL